MFAAGQERRRGSVFSLVQTTVSKEREGEERRTMRAQSSAQKSRFCGTAASGRIRTVPAEARVDDDEEDEDGARKWKRRRERESSRTESKGGRRTAGAASSNVQCSMAPHEEAGSSRALTRGLRAWLPSLYAPPYRSLSFSLFLSRSLSSSLFLSFSL